MIGIYDSGIGGLGIYEEIKAVFPHESILYYGDTQYFPFGGRGKEEIRDITVAALQKLEPRCAIIVIACNSSSVNDLDYYREQVNVPIIGVVPVIKTAAQLTKNDHIALLATEYTAAAPYTNTLIEKFADGKHVTTIACEGLADAVESGSIEDEEQIINHYLSGIGESDVVVLGCTHYTLVKGLIQGRVGPDVKVIDSNEAAARQTLRVMQDNKLEDPQDDPEYLFECSGDQAVFLKQVNKYATAAT